MWQKLRISCAFAFVVYFLTLFSPKKAMAATLYWVGANGSVASNWKTTDPATCGSGNASAAPVAADTIILILIVTMG